jgi:hypothetical protein
MGIAVMIPMFNLNDYISDEELWKKSDIRKRVHDQASH